MRSLLAQELIPMTDCLFLMMLRQSHEPTSHLLLECETILCSTDSDTQVCRLIGYALDRWGITKEEMQIRNRLSVEKLNGVLENEPTLRAAST